MKYAYRDASMELVTYALRCFRMAEGKKLKPDIDALVSLGEKLTSLNFEFWRDRSSDSASRLVDTPEARWLAYKLEDALLRGREEDYSSEHTERLRGLGLDRLVKIGEILKKAGEPGFTEYASALDEFFKYWKEWADELDVTGGPGVNIIFDIFGRPETPAA